MSGETQKVRKADGVRVFTLRMRLPVLVVSLFLLILGLIWIFVVGVLVGRGYNTREEIGVLAAFMPAPQVD